MGRRYTPEIESPCINVCEIDRETRMCRGCFRTVTEIGFWSRMSDEERAEIMDELPSRAPLVSRRRGRGE